MLENQKTLRNIGGQLMLHIRSMVYLMLTMIRESQLEIGEDLE
mgnify:CR=1 FL=1|nr:MAG TPA: hypothetical protein [Bacteriophage sp.]